MMHPDRAAESAVSATSPRKILWFNDLHECSISLVLLPPSVASRRHTAMATKSVSATPPAALCWMRMTGGAFAANSLPEMYYDTFIQGTGRGAWPQSAPPNNTMSGSQP